MRAYERVLIHVMKERETRKPSISEMYSAGSLMGLDENDVRRLYRVTTTSKLKESLAHSFLWFLFSLLAVIAIALILSWFLSKSHQPVMYGVAPMYAVGNVALLRDRIFPF